MTAEGTKPDTKTTQIASWSLWLRQIRAIFRLEIRKNFFGKRSVLIYLLAFLPIFLLGSLALIMLPALGSSAYIQQEITPIRSPNTLRANTNTGERG